MNIVEVANLLKNMPDDSLQTQMQQPSPGVPQYLVMSELQRRKAMRTEAAPAQPQTTTVAQDMAMEAQPVPGGIADLPQTAQGGPGFAEGGIVSFAEGGEVRKRPKTIGEMWGPEPPEENTWAYKLKQFGNWLTTPGQDPLIGGKSDRAKMPYDPGYEKPAVPSGGYTPAADAVYDPHTGVQIGGGVDYGDAYDRATNAVSGAWDTTKKFFSNQADPAEPKKEEPVLRVETNGTNGTAKPTGNGAAGAGGARVVGSPGQNADIAGLGALPVEVPGSLEKTLEEVKARRGGIEAPKMLTVQERLAELQKDYVDPYSGYDKLLADRKGDIDKRGKDSVSMALMQAGLSMAAAKGQHFLQNAAEGGIAGLRQYGTDRKELSREEQALLDKQLSVTTGRAQEQNRLRGDARLQVNDENRYATQNYKTELQAARDDAKWQLQYEQLVRQYGVDQARAIIDAKKLEQGDRRIEAMIYGINKRAEGGGGGGGRGRVTVSEKERVKAWDYWNKLKPRELEKLSNIGVTSFDDYLSYKYSGAPPGATDGSGAATAKPALEINANRQWNK